MECIDSITFPDRSYYQYYMNFPEFKVFISFRMGSFTSMSKIIPASDADTDIKREFRGLANAKNSRDAGNNKERDLCTLNAFLDHCSKGLIGLPEPISRAWKKAPTGNQINSMETPACYRQENIRVLQWNVLSQSKSLPLPKVDI